MQQNPKLKILLSVGGWQAEGFSDAALTEDSRRDFTESAVKLLDALHLAADREFVENIDLHQVPDYLDWINLMSYDFFNSLTATTGPHAGLYRAEHALPRDRNDDSAVSQYLAAGVPPEKIVLGVAAPLGRNHVLGIERRPRR